MDMHNATLEQLVNIRYCDEEAPLADKAAAEAEIIRRQQLEAESSDQDFLAWDPHPLPEIGD
ncbi:hypothetical protein SAMN04487969_101113 [Paenibacillus algorifonticola]|uniref:Uncharacterized protein n=1 Tax=Paenibacillus algorifonticola TaxID=684063 RepID=A0A1I1XV20_9BACL|nr:hypothetical protein [Paenibacillus algorifonticola]SFE11176.1 hypothetical protein SAMN04487969_101113 [Paenibacillus algorifonticola]